MKKRTTVLLTGLAMTLLPMVAAPSAQAVCGEVGGPYVNANGCLMPGEGAAIAGSIVAADAWDERGSAGRAGRRASPPRVCPTTPPGICPADQRRCCTMLTTLPSGARTKNR